MDYTQDRPTLIAAEFHVGAVHGRDDAAATIAASGAVRNDWHPAGEVVAEFAVHKSMLP